MSKDFRIYLLTKVKPGEISLNLCIDLKQLLDQCQNKEICTFWKILACSKKNNLFLFGGWNGGTEVKWLVWFCLDNLRLTLGKYRGFKKY